MMERRACPALFVSAPASNQGKTTITAALARFHSAQGRVVRVFKTGPDFLDPMIHERASGFPAYQLDLWMGGEEHCRNLLYDAAGDADLILIEGVMGLFDGTPSSADLAQLLGVPVLAVIDAESMAQSFGAIAHGLASYRDGLPFYGVLANRVAGARHAELLQQGMRAELAFLGAVLRDSSVELPDRHLGLVQAEEVGDLEQRLNAAAAALKSTGLTELPPAVEFAGPESSLEGRPESGPDGKPAGKSESELGRRAEILSVPPRPTLAGLRIGIARDQAFSFLYPANLDLLRALGAELVFFSPLVDSELPPVDSVYLPGGYPELHLPQLSANRAMALALRRHVDAGKPLYAECGGMLYLLESLTDVKGQRAALAAVLPGSATMQPRLRGLGYQSAPCPAGGVLRGHTFHHSTMETSLKPWAHGERVYNTSPGEAIYCEDRLVASYLHNYFPSNPQAAAGLFQR
jgi:cobyrinic acid a,c-diamide synthase